jgi:hypothetical protein
MAHGKSSEERGLSPVGIEGDLEAVREKHAVEAGHDVDEYLPLVLQCADRRTAEG